MNRVSRRELRLSDSAVLFEEKGERMEIGMRGVRYVLVLAALGLACGLPVPAQSNVQETREARAQLKQERKADKAQAKADKGERKALGTKQQKHADRAQDKADREAVKAGRSQ